MNVVRYRISRRGTLFPQIYSSERIIFRSYAKKKRPKEIATQKAIEHFDGLYKTIFRNKWPSIRLALLSTSKYVALVNNFGNSEETEKSLKKCGALELRSLLRSDEDDEIESVVKFDDSYIERFSIEYNEEDKEEEEEEDKEEEEEEEEEEDKEALSLHYPEGSEERFDRLFENYKVTEKDIWNETEEEKKDDSDSSLSAALSKSEIDIHRLIDPASGDGSLHEFIPVTDMKRGDNYMDEGDYYRFFQVSSDFPVNMKKENELVFPDNLKAYSFPRGIVSVFDRPRPSINSVLNYYLLDGASILPVLALDLQAGDRVLDMCAAPGGKALAILQTMLPDYLVCNEASLSRSNRLKNVFYQYLDGYPEDWPNVFLCVDDKELYTKKFNKILVDVPCTTDKHSVMVDANNIFKTTRIRERLKLPETQSTILEQALLMVEPGGTVVYSTCSLSPIQNDGVVNMTLQRIYNQSRIEFTVCDLSEATRKLRPFFKFASPGVVKYGSLVVPFLPLNFGPMYFCKIIKNK